MSRVFNRHSLRKHRGISVHLGCGDERLPSFFNIDCRPTKATDYIADLNQPECFGLNSVRVFFSHAFFEHLYRNERVPHLRRIVQALQSDGVCCYIGLPNFKAIAKLYLERGPGVVGERFDLFNVYRYTHGDPEKVLGWWLEQLHKSLFDEDEVTNLLAQSGFATSVIFTYCFVGERDKPVNLGFFATKAPYDVLALRDECMQFLSRNCVEKVLLDTVEFI
jgi:predicted SAM-dependent methyltransferase